MEISKRPSRHHNHLESDNYNFFKNYRHLAWLGGIITLIGLIIFVLFSPYFLIQDILIVRGSVEVDNAKIQEILKPFYGQNIFLASNETITNLIQDNFPEVKIAKLKRSLPNALNIEITNYPLVAEIIPTDAWGIKNKNAKLVLNSIGMILITPPEELAENLPKITFYPTPEKWEEKKIIISTKWLNFILLTNQRLSDEFLIGIKNIEYYSKEREIHIETTKSFKIILDLTKNSDSQINKLKIATKEIPLNKSDLEYIDLRIKSKIFYKKNK